MDEKLRKDRKLPESVFAEYGQMPGALLPVLHAVQEHFGYIPKETVPEIAEALNLSRAEVHGVISFYHHFRSTPPGKLHIQLCRAEACQAMGSANLERHVKASLNVDYHQTSNNGDYSLEPVYCLGNCACTPSVMINDQLYGQVSPERFDEIMSDLQTQEAD
ncbi:MAG: formate dehydrogenase subunit gamma [Gammaproteobacteria bacterium]|nr:formate dehydrogenase subunit gamma [Gammaproteobacteria bacterium]